MIRSSRRHVNSIAMPLGISAVFFLVAACTKQVPSGRVGKVERADLVQRVTVAGKAVPNRRAIITAPYSGYVHKMHVRTGSRLKKGAPVVTLTQALGAAAGELFPIRSPFNGTAVQVLRSEGEYVRDSGDDNVLVIIDDLSRMFLDADVPESDLVKLRKGQEVLIRVSALPARTYNGIIRRIALSSKEAKKWGANENAVLFPVRIEITDADEEIRPGMSAIVDIIAQKKEKVLTLRHEYIRPEGTVHYVTLKDGSRREVEIGLQNELMTEILSGLEEGDEVLQIDFTSLMEQAEQAR